MTRFAIFFYGVIVYALFFATFLYSICFIGDFRIVPTTLDFPRPELGVATSIAINLALLGLFGLQHSVMARPAFKRWFTRTVPQAAERSTYVLASVVAMWLLFAFWQPVEGTIWHAESEVARSVLTGLYFAGFGLVFLSTVLLNHFELFGLRQVWLELRGREYTALPFETPSLYKYIRHPLYVGWITVFWATPTMSIGHLLFAGGCTAYIFVALIFEERDLVEHFGDTYRNYQARVPGFIPRPGRRATSEELTASGSAA